MYTDGIGTRIIAGHVVDVEEGILGIGKTHHGAANVCIAIHNSLRKVSIFIPTKQNECLSKLIVTHNVLNLQMPGHTELGYVRTVYQWILAEPQSHRVLHNTADIEGRLPMSVYATQVLTDIAKAIRIIAVIVLQIARLQVQGGQIFQFLVPHHCGHACCRIIAGQLPCCHKIAPLIVLIHNEVAMWT